MRCAGTLIAGGCLFLALTGSAQAVQFKVNSRADKPDQTDVDGKCKATNGKCTLRAAVTEANVQPGLDVVKVPKGTYRLTIAGPGENAEGDLDVFEQVILKGAGATETTVRQTVKDRILEVHGGAPTAVKNMTLTGGRAEEDGGAILAAAPLTVDHSTLKGNRALSAGMTGASGGAIRAGSSLSVVSSKILNNTAHATSSTANGGGIITTDDNWIINRSVIAGNEARMTGAATDAAGGGIHVGQTGQILESTFSANKANAGGGVFSNSSDPVTITASTLNGNVATDRGGGVSMGNGTVTILNSTLSGNEVTGGSTGGGGLFRFSGNATVSFSTIAGNTGPGGIAGGIQAGSSAGTVTLHGSMLANPGTNCGNPGHLASLGYNVTTDGSCSLAGTGDITTTNPKLGPLADNGGRTKTMALKPASPAVDHVTSGCPPPTVDQRGEDRPSGAACDAGSYEK